MLEMKDGKKILTTPISEEDLKDIHIGDIVYLNGSMTTCRDVAHRRGSLRPKLLQKLPPPVSFRNPFAQSARSAGTLSLFQSKM